MLISAVAMGSEVSGSLALELERQLWCECWELNWDLPEKQHVPLTAEPGRLILK